MTLVIDKEKCKISNNKGIIMLRFSASRNFSVEQFCNDAQEVLYDKIGATGHFRMAPLDPTELTEQFIVGYGAGAKHKGFHPRNDNEVFAAFHIEETDPDVPLEDELSILPTELKEFCDTCNYSAEQVDIRTMY
tara:strand:- start:88 stop:489 length:402 start_codon:yes stop_codon:yes gene_type:complete